VGSNKRPETIASPNVIRTLKSERIEWKGHVVRKGEDRSILRGFRRKYEGNRPLEKPRYRWNDLKEIS
jgi:hypothetical protein